MRFARMLSGMFAGAVIVVASAGPASASLSAPGDWTQYGFGPRHHGLNPLEDILSPSNVGDLQVAWSTEQEGGWFHPVSVADGLVYDGNDKGFVFAYDAVTGALEWSRRAEPFGWIDSAPAIASGIVVIGGLDNLYGLDAADGTILWKVEGQFQSSPAIVGATAYANDGAGEYALAIDVGTGQVQWRTHLDDFTKSSPAVAGGAAYLKTNAGTVYSLDASTGSVRWTARVGHLGYEDPVVLGGVVLIRAASGALRALDAATGVRVRTYDLNVPLGGSPATADGVLFVPSADGSIVAARAGSGRVLWTAPLPTTPSTPTVANGVVYASTFLPTNGLTALDAATGEVLRELPGVAWGYSPPVIAHGAVYVTDGGTVSALRLPGA
jgi:outer membrane protein assembly factor BamB